MEKKAASGIMLTLLLASMLAIASNIQPAKPRPATTVSICPTTSTALIGKTFTVNVTIADVLNLYGWQFNLTFSPSVLQVISVVEGPFLSSMNSTMWPTPHIDNSAGHVMAYATFMPPFGSHGADGNGTLAIVTFEVGSYGQTPLAFDEASTKLRTIVDGDVLPIEYEAFDGYFSTVDTNAVILITTMGNVTIELFGDMPITAGNFRNLTQFGVYDGTLFHRVIPDFVIQGGDASAKGIVVPPILDELPNKHSNLRGYVAMAKTSEPNSARDQFYINLVNNTYLDSNYSVFAKVVAGMNVVDMISEVPTDNNDRPLQDVMILKAQLAAYTSANVGLVLATGGLGDKSLNEVTWTGVKRAEEELGIDFDYVEPTAIAEYEGYQRALAATGTYEIIICVGFDQADALTKVAAEYPIQRFAIVDGVVDKPNVASLLFKVNEGSFLAGVIAGMKTRSGEIGFVGAMDIPLVRDYFMGYEAGAKWANSTVEMVTPVFVGGWADPTKGRELALGLIDLGVDVIYGEAGKSGLGVLQAVHERGIMGLGADACQCFIYPEVIASMTKRVDVAAFDTIKATIRRTFQGGIHTGGLKEGWVGCCRLPEEEDLWEEMFGLPHALLDMSVIDKIGQARDKIVAGEITVPSTLMRVPGVSAGDWWAGLVHFTWLTSPYQDPWCDLMSQTVWMKSTILEVSGTNVTFSLLYHFKNGTERDVVGWIDVATGHSNAGSSLMILPYGLISADLSVGAPIYTEQAPYNQWRVTARANRTYDGNTVETNILNVTTPASSLVAYFSKDTGIICESQLTVNGHYSVYGMIFEGSIVVPEFPSIIVLPLLMILSILAVVLAKRKICRKIEA